MTISHLVSGAMNWDKTIFVQKFPKIGEEVEVERGRRKRSECCGLVS